MNDLHRPHGFAKERIGFFMIRKGTEHLHLVTGYLPVLDSEYVHAPAVGACIGTDAIRRMVGVASSENIGLLHVHMHEHNGVPRPSPTDRRDVPGLVKAFMNASPSSSSGYIILSNDRACGEIMTSGSFKPFGKISCVGGFLGFLTTNLHE